MKDLSHICVDYFFNNLAQNLLNFLVTRKIIRINLSLYANIIKYLCNIPYWTDFELSVHIAGVEYAPYVVEINNFVYQYIIIFIRDCT